MSDDEADLELLELLRETLGLGKKRAQDEVSTDTGEKRDTPSHTSVLNLLLNAAHVCSTGKGKI